MIIKGAGEIIEKNSTIIRPGSIDINILPEIDVKNYGKDRDSIEKLKNDTYKIFLQNI